VFFGKGYGQNGLKFFSDPDMTIFRPMKSSWRVEKKYAVSKIF
jgi:hypothetical protein